MSTPTARPPASVVLAGGGTTGHVAPLLATAEALRTRHPGTRVTVLGTREGLESRLVPAAGLDLRHVPRVPLPRRPSGDLVRLPVRLTRAVRGVRRVLDEVDAHVVVGFGGYVATPAYLAARRAHVPVVVHEQNALPGVANKLGARLTRHVAVTFPGTPLPHAVVLGMPLRRAITELDRPALRAEGRAAFGLHPDLPTLLVTGGSLGAQRLNEAVPRAASALAAAGLQVLHVSGRGKHVPLPPGTTADPSSPPDGPRYVVVDYVERMDLAYAAADAVVCRAGAGTVCELAALGLPAAYVPLPVGNGEQRLNAQPLVAAGGGLLVDDEEFTPEWVTTTLLPVLRDPAQLLDMAAAARSFGTLDAAGRLADLVLDAAREAP
ncbi:undecaprenyldiphospho-muramoylpentapeptide beta-N-acetylglucosaminyltransferase [Aquipuribacter nitratireducens]|uniref:UDP-N-acetylglucosamine--N-acetylmuramyl-(pentapeptide) pyrophosphoryl-undecaprenol N-acetylglucosamine transferase n=1 Tax=Aquipuribacter nitratireducens TaxID=650104 RepID=A0ABW0GQE9_9MICO